MKNIIYLKKLVASVLLTSVCASTSFARIEYSESTTVTDNISDNWVFVDYPTMAGNMSTTRGNVVVTVEKEVSVTASYLNVYGTGSSLVFLGNKQVNIGQISIYGGAGSTGASMEFYNSTINAGSIYLREGGTSLLVKDSTVTVSGKLNLNPDAKIIIDGGSIIASSFSQIGSDSYVTTADIRVLNKGSFVMSGGSGNAHEHNIYVDSTSSFTSTNKDTYGGTLTVEVGAEVTFAADSKTSFESVTLILDYVIEDTGSELNLSGFNNIKMGEETVTFASLSENVIVQGTNGDQYEMLYDETTKSYSAGEYIGTVVPEPSTYAMIFGALSLGFAMYRRRK